MFDENTNICIFGMRGAGKSTLCREIQTYYNNIFIFDTLCEYNNSDGIIVSSYQDFSNYVIKTSKLNRLKIIIQLPIDHASDQELMDEYIKLLYYRGNCTIVIEEVQNFATVHKMPIYLKQVSLTGRHKKVNFITTTQRIAEIHKSLLSQSHHIFAGYTDSPNDQKTLKEYGFNLDEIQKLEKFNFLWKNEREIVKIDNSINFI